MLSFPDGQGEAAQMEPTEHEDVFRRRPFLQRVKDRVKRFDLGYRRSR